jgi:hypothetical protein
LLPGLIRGFDPEELKGLEPAVVFRLTEDQARAT